MSDCPRSSASGLVVFFGITQHSALAEDVLDHRLNSRTVYMNPVFRFLYLNMNYHIEHHIFPMVPYHALPALHEEIRAHVPEPFPHHLVGVQGVRSRTHQTAPRSRELASTRPAREPGAVRGRAGARHLTEPPP